MGRFMWCIRQSVVCLFFLLVWVVTLSCFAQQASVDKPHHMFLTLNQPLPPTEKEIPTAQPAKSNQSQPVAVHHTINERSPFLAFITNPNIAYILLLIGICGLLFELLNPGLVFPSVIGVVSLVLALYAFSLLPINYIGLTLLLTGIISLVAEAFFATGIFAVVGITAFILGSLFLLQNIPGFRIALGVILGASLVVALFFLIIIRMAIRSQRRPIVSGSEQLMGSIGTVVSIDPGQTLARIQGELWQIKSSQPLQVGQKVIVNSREGLVLSVNPVQ